MSFPAPRPGLVVRYGFLWRHEYEVAADEASKDRPCAVVVATSSGHAGDIRVMVSPITHRPPDDPAFITHALGTVAPARGMTHIAREAGVSRESLYRALQGRGNPEFATMLRVMEAVGLRLGTAVTAG
jgi:probable addiction module antidote protein